MSVLGSSRGNGIGSRLSRAGIGWAEGAGSRKRLGLFDDGTAKCRSASFTGVNYRLTITEAGAAPPASLPEALTKTPAEQPTTVIAPPPAPAEPAFNMSEVATAFLDGNFTAARKTAQANPETAALLARVVTGHQRLLDSFMRDRGETVQVKLPKETAQLKIIDVRGGQISAARRLENGSISFKFTPANLHWHEMVRRLGPTDPATALYVGTLALRANDPKEALARFKRSDSELGRAIVVAMQDRTGGTRPTAVSAKNKHEGVLGTIPDAAGYRLIFDLDLNKATGHVMDYTVDESANTGKFSRVAYFLELTSDAGEHHLYVSMDAFTEDATKVGVPTAEMNVTFQQALTNLTVVSNHPDIVTGSELTGNIEFWSTNYKEGNNAKVPEASGRVYDHGDQPGGAAKGYGSMQIHNPSAKQTLFAVNSWHRGGDKMDVGIGNSTGKTLDWTFTHLLSAEVMFSGSNHQCSARSVAMPHEPQDTCATRHGSRRGCEDVTHIEQTKLRK